MLSRANKNVDPLADSATYAPAARMRKVVPVAMPRGTISFWCGQVYSSRCGQFLGSAEVERVSPLQLSLQQVDPLIRELTQYRDLIEERTKEPNP